MKAHTKSYHWVTASLLAAPSLPLAAAYTVRGTTSTAATPHSTQRRHRRHHTWREKGNSDTTYSADATTTTHAAQTAPATVMAPAAPATTTHRARRPQPQHTHHIDSDGGPTPHPPPQHTGREDRDHDTCATLKTTAAPARCIRIRDHDMRGATKHVCAPGIVLPGLASAHFPRCGGLGSVYIDLYCFFLFNKSVINTNLSLRT
jgi:hypothetical protein